MLTCASCGEQNPERARFCLNCGAPLASEQRRGARKVVTVVVCDVTGSTALGERLDPESLGRVMARYFERTRAVLERHHGLVQKFIGDAVVATFGVPVVREDDALRAVRAAAAMQDAVADLDEAGGPAIEVRIGVSTGEVMVEEAGGDPLVIGEAVNLATRLQAAAGPGEVLLDRRTWHLSRDALVAAEVEGVGGSGGLEDRPPVDGAWRLVDVSPDALGHARRSDNPLVGRLAELQLFDWMFQRTVRTSTCHLLTVLGPAGVGKSRLVAAAVDAIGDAATVLYGQCSSGAEGSSFWPLAEIVRRAAEIKTADSPEQAEAKLEALLDDPDAEQVTDRLGRLIGLRPAPVTSEDAVWAVRRFLEVLAGRHPLVVVIDDLHWAQPALLDLVEQVVALAREASILVVAVARPELLEQRPGWSGGRLNASTMLLEPLAAEESATLLEHLAGEAALPGDATERITRTAEGNPLFLEELLAMLIEEGRLRRDGGRWVADDLGAATTPPTIQALLAARLDRLAGEERALLDRASVMGQAFDRAAVLALTPEPARAAADAHLLALVRKELLRPAQAPLGGRDGFQFRHQLVRDAAYDSLPKQARAELHERYAGWLAQAYAARGGEVGEVLGWHLERAYRFLTELGPVDAHGRQVAERRRGPAGRGRPPGHRPRRPAGRRQPAGAGHRPAPAGRPDQAGAAHRPGRGPGPQRRDRAGPAGLRRGHGRRRAHRRPGAGRQRQPGQAGAAPGLARPGPRPLPGRRPAGPLAPGGPRRRAGPVARLAAAGAGQLPALPRRPGRGRVPAGGRARPRRRRRAGRGRQPVRPGAGGVLGADPGRRGDPPLPGDPWPGRGQLPGGDVGAPHPGRAPRHGRRVRPGPRARRPGRRRSRTSSDRAASPPCAASSSARWSCWPATRGRPRAGCAGARASWSGWGSGGCARS